MLTWTCEYEQSTPPRRYELPAYWASSIFNGDDSGLEDGEREQIDAFIKREGLEGWTEADCGESYFSHSNHTTKNRKMKTEYKWIATKGEQYQRTVGFGFFTKKDAQEFAARENRRHNSGYYVARVSEVKSPKFI